MLLFFYSVEKRFHSVQNLVEKLCWSTELTHERCLKMPICFGRFDSDISDQKEFHTNLHILGKNPKGKMRYFETERTSEYRAAKRHVLFERKRLFCVSSDIFHRKNMSNRLNVPTYNNSSYRHVFDLKMYTIRSISDRHRNPNY